MCNWRVYLHEINKIWREYRVIDKVNTNNTCQIVGEKKAAVTSPFPGADRGTRCIWVQCGSGKQKSLCILFPPCLILARIMRFPRVGRGFHKIWANIGSCLYSPRGRSPRNKPQSVADPSVHHHVPLIWRRWRHWRNIQRHDPTGIFSPEPHVSEIRTVIHQLTLTKRLMDPHTCTTQPVNTPTHQQRHSDDSVCLQ